MAQIGQMRLEKSNIPANLTSKAYDALAPANVSSYSPVPSGQLGMNESALPVQPGGASNGSSSLINTASDGNVSLSESWRDVLLDEVANRYIARCVPSWCLLPSLPVRG